jgi:hypothetical protein
MEEKYFKLISTYEVIVDNGKIEYPLRIEIFVSCFKDRIYRTRVWSSNTYNLYPTFLNIDDAGNAVQQIFSCDQFDVDITSVIAKNPELITGINFESEEEFFKYVKHHIDDYIDDYIKRRSQ